MDDVWTFMEIFIWPFKIDLIEMGYSVAYLAYSNNNFFLIQR